MHFMFEPKLTIWHFQAGIECIQTGTVANLMIRQFVATRGETFRLETGAVKVCFETIRWHLAGGSA